MAWHCKYCPEVYQGFRGLEDHYEHDHGRQSLASYPKADRIYLMEQAQELARTLDRTVSVTDVICGQYK